MTELHNLMNFKVYNVVDMTYLLSIISTIEKLMIGIITHIPIYDYMLFHDDNLPEPP